MLKLSGHRPTMGGSASRRAATCVKPEQASKGKSWAPTRLHNGEGRWITREQPTDDRGIAHRGKGRGTSTQSMAQHGRPMAARGRDPQRCKDGAAAVGVGGAHSTVWTCRTTEPAGREGALVRGVSRRAKGWEIGVSLATPSKLRRLQEALYTKAKQEGAQGPDARDTALPRRRGVRGAGSVSAPVLAS